MKLHHSLLGPSTFTFTFTLVAVFALAGCSGKALDGGSNTGSSGSSGSSGGSGTGNGSSGSSGTGTGTDDGIADQPLQGTVIGHAFTPKSVDLTFQKAQNQWFLTLRDYTSNCGVLPDGPPAADALTVNIGGVEPKAGETSIAFADGHGASFQVGTTKDAQVKAADSGTLRLDTWTDTTGQTITGALHLSAGEGNEIVGTFTANVCPAR